MKIFKVLLIVFASFSSVFTTKVFASDNGFTVYLIRHAEKHLNQKNPSLTICGKQRAQLIADTLSQASIKAIYSSNYTRTLQTAEPLATNTALKVNHYDPRDLAAIAKLVKSKHENALVVGHSNTTPQLTTLFSQQTVSSITEAEYQMLYQVTFIGEKAVLSILQQPFSCQK